MKRSKAWRRHKESAVINKRLKFIKQFWRQWSPELIERYKKERHRLLDRHPCDCGKSQCYLCNGDKLLNIENPHDVKRSKIKDEEYEEWYMMGLLNLEENLY